MPSTSDNLDGTGRADSQELGFEATDAPFELRALEIALDVVSPCSKILPQPQKSCTNPEDPTLVHTVLVCSPLSCMSWVRQCVLKLCRVTDDEPPAQVVFAARMTAVWLCRQVCGHLERQSVDLEAAAHPALDALTRKVHNFISQSPHEPHLPC